jgi:hypothetical protein
MRTHAPRHVNFRGYITSLRRRLLAAHRRGKALVKALFQFHTIYCAMLERSHAIIDVCQIFSPNLGRDSSSTNPIGGVIWALQELALIYDVPLTGTPSNYSAPEKRCAEPHAYRLSQSWCDQGVLCAPSALAICAARHLQSCLLGSGKIIK